MEFHGLNYSSRMSIHHIQHYIFEWLIKNTKRKDFFGPDEQYPL